MNKKFKNNQSGGDEIFATNDLSCAAALVTADFVLVSLDKTNPRKAHFLFKRNSQLDELVESYWREELKVEPQAYFNALRVIKARLYGAE